MTIDLVDALETYTRTLASWRIVPLDSSQWNDKGVLRYKKAWAIQEVFKLPNYSTSSLSDSQERHLLDYEWASTFVKLKSMQAMFESLGIESK